MRKYIIIICVCLLFTIMCCSICASYCLEQPDEISYEGVVDLSVGFYDEYSIEFDVDEKLAAEIGIAAIKMFFKEQDFSKNIFTIHEYEKEGIFIVASIPKFEVKNKGNERIVKRPEDAGPCIHVAIRKEDGAILKMWPGE